MVKCNCENTELPKIENDCCGLNLNIERIIFIKNTDFISDKYGNFIRMKRKYGKFTRQIYASKEAMFASFKDERK